MNKAPSFGSGSPDRKFDYNILHSPCSCPSTYLTTPKGSQLFILFRPQGESVIAALGVSEKQELSAGSWRPTGYSICLVGGRVFIWEFICGFQACPCHHTQSTLNGSAPHGPFLEHGSFCLPQEDGFIYFSAIIIMNSWPLLLGVSLLTHFCLISRKSHG